MSESWEKLCKSFTPEKLLYLIRNSASNFRPRRQSLDIYIKDNEIFDKADQIGVIEIPDERTVIVGVVRVRKELTFRTGKRKQYDLAKDILKNENHNAGIFAYYDDAGRFRFSLVTFSYVGTKKLHSAFRRHTFFVDPDLPNKTFLNQMRRADFSSFAGIKEAFSLEAVSDEFYKEFEPKFRAIADSVIGIADEDLKQDLALLFVIRVIFLGFVQKKDGLVTTKGSYKTFGKNINEQVLLMNSIDTG